MKEVQNALLVKKSVGKPCTVSDWHAVSLFGSAHDQLCRVSCTCKSPALMLSTAEALC